MQPAFGTLFDAHIGTVFARQLLFSKYLGPQDQPKLDLEKGTADFGAGRVFAIQLLGTQLDAEDAWLWAWAEQNETPFPPALLLDSQELKAKGVAEHIDTLEHPKLVLELSSVPLVPDEFNGDHIASVAAGIFNTAYWREPLDNGLLFYLVKGLPTELTGPYEVPYILETIEQVASYYSTDNEAMVEYFLKQQGFSVQWQDVQEDKTEDSEEGVTLLAHRGAEEITARFDAEYVLQEIEAHGFEGEENYQEQEDQEAQDWWDAEDPDQEFPPPLGTA